MTLLRCNDCRWAGMLHCSDPFNCDGMKMPTWEETNEELERMNQVLIALHNRPERDWELHEKDAARIARRKCIELGEYRYKLLRTK